MNSRTAALALAALLAVLTACSGSPAPAPASSAAPSSAAPISAAVPDRQPHTLVLNADGSGSLKQVTYTLDGVTKEAGQATMPWRQSLTVPSDGKPHQWTLEITYSGASGKVDMYSVFDGKESVHTASGGASSGSGNVTGSASIGGTVQG